eukprot:scaffold39032_cov17-Prasinocladus_malaysianus.AAC.1
MDSIDAEPSEKQANPYGYEQRARQSIVFAISTKPSTPAWAGWNAEPKSVGRAPNQRHCSSVTRGNFQPYRVRNIRVIPAWKEVSSAAGIISSSN